MSQRHAQPAQPKRLTADVGMDRNIKHQWLLDTLLDHLIKLIHDHVTKFTRTVLSQEHRWRVIYLNRVWNRQNRARAGLHPNRLVIAGPVHDIRVLCFFEQIGRRRVFIGPSPHPSLGRAPFSLDKGVRDLLNHALFIRFPHKVVYVFSIGALVPDDFITSTTNRIENLRRFVVQQAIGVVSGRYVQLLE